MQINCNSFHILSSLLNKHHIGIKLIFIDSISIDNKINNFLYYFSKTKHKKALKSTNLLKFKIILIF